MRSNSAGWPTSWGSTTSGRWSITSWRSTRTASAPEVFLTAVAAQTQRIRVGHGAVVCVPEMNNPIRVAERAAALDIISNGRLELGTARSSTWTELGGFCADPDDTKKTWDEFCRVIPQMWTDDDFGWEGARFEMPARNVIPKPFQEPHPPMWVTVTTPGTELDAAERGLGCLGVSAAPFAEQERRTKEYYRRVANCDPVGSFVNDQVHTLNFLYCHEDYRQAAALGLPMVGAFSMSNAHLYFTREAYPTRAYQTLGNAGAALRSRGTPNGSTPADDPSVAKGLPERRRHRRPRPSRADYPQVGGRRRDRHQLPAQRHGDDPPAAGTGQPAAVRDRGHPAVPDGGRAGCPRAGTYHRSRGQFT